MLPDLSEMGCLVMLTSLDLKVEKMEGLSGVSLRLVRKMALTFLTRIMLNVSPCVVSGFSRAPFGNVPSLSTFLCLAANPLIKYHMLTSAQLSHSHYPKSTSSGVSKQPTQPTSLLLPTPVRRFPPSSPVFLFHHLVLKDCIRSGTRSPTSAVIILSACATQH